MLASYGVTTAGSTTMSVPVVVVVTDSKLNSPAMLSHLRVSTVSTIGAELPSSMMSGIGASCGSGTFTWKSMFSVTLFP